MLPTLFPTRSCQQGASLVTFTLVALPLILMGLLVIEATQWHLTRQLLSLALLEAARAASSAHAHPHTLAQAFEAALQPLFPAAGSYGRFQARRQALGLLPWHIEIVQPNTATFSDFTDATLTLPAARGRRAIRNDYQAEQHAYRQNQGWHEGRGPQSGLTIFEANTLRLRLTYYHQPLTPGIQTVLRWLATRQQAADASAAQQGLLTLRVNMALTMHTHPVDWGSSSLYRLPSKNPQTPLRTPEPMPAASLERVSPVNTPSDIGANFTQNPSAPLPLTPFIPPGELGPLPARDAFGCGVLLCCDL